MNIKRDTQIEERDKTERDTLARARPPSEGCHIVTRDTSARNVTSRRDSDTPALKLRGVTITQQCGGDSAAARTAAHKAKLATDPRFAALFAGMRLDTNASPSGRLRVIEAGLKLEPFADPYPDPETLAANVERAELHRRACQAALQRAERGEDVPEDYLAWARAVVARFQPLPHHLSTGDPA